MDNHARCQTSDLPSPEARQRRGGFIRLQSLKTGALGMLAEVLFACGLMLVGFAISLLSGW